MLSSLSGNAIMAKARAIYGKRITKSQYDELIKLNSVGEIASYLKNETQYSSMLAGIQPGEIHRGQLENLLRREIFDEYSRLYHYLDSNREDFFKFEIMLDDIKEILRMILLIKADNAQNYILDMPAYLITKSTVDLLAMAKVRSYDELVQVLENTRYASIIKKYRPTPENPVIDYIACEHSFMDYYYFNLIKAIKRMYKGDEQKQLMDLTGVRVELINLTIIYRSKAYFRSQSGDIVHRILPYYHKLSSRKISELAQAEDENEFEKMLKQTYLRNKLEKIDFDYIEHFAYSIWYHEAQKLFRFSTYTAVSFYAFGILRSIELFNITNIIEGIRYQIPKEEIRDTIIV